MGLDSKGTPDVLKSRSEKAKQDDKEIHTSEIALADRGQKYMDSAK